MGKKYLDTKENTLESSILGVWTEAAKKEELSTKQKKLDVDGDGEIEGSDLAKLRKKGAKKEGNAFGMALKAAKDKGEKTFVVSGKTYEVKESVDLDEETYDERMKKLTGFLKDAEKEKPLDKEWISGLKDMIKKTKAAGKKYYDRDEEVEIDEGLGVAEDIPAMEIGTDRYREYAVGLTPGENAEFAAAQDFKVASMKEALAKVWGLDEKALDKTSKEEYDEEDEELKPVKGSKTMTGGKVAKVDTKPKIG